MIDFSKPEQKKTEAIKPEVLPPEPEQKNYIPEVAKDVRLDLEEGKKRLAPYTSAVGAMLQEANELKVTSEETNERAVALGTSAKKLNKQIEKQRKTITGDPFDFVKSVNAFAKAFTQRLDSIERIMKKKITDYRSLQEQKRREAEVAAKKAQEKLQKELDTEAEQKGFEPVKVETPTIPKEKPPVRTDTGAAHGKKTWTFELEDLEQVPREYLTLNEKKVRDGVKAGVRKILGIRIFQKESTTFRTS